MAADQRSCLPTESDIPAHGWSPYSDFHRERIRAHEKHHAKPGGSMEMKGYAEPDWLAVLVEEVGEVAKVLCDHRHGLLTNGQMVDELRTELVQVGAMTAAWVDAIHRGTAAAWADEIAGEGTEAPCVPPRATDAEASTEAPLPGPADAGWRQGRRSTTMTDPTCGAEFEWSGFDHLHVCNLGPEHPHIRNHVCGTCGYVWPKVVTSTSRHTDPTVAPTST